MNTTFQPFSLLLLNGAVKAIEFNTSPIKLVGLHSPVTLALYLSQATGAQIHNRPHVIVLPDQAACDLFVEALSFFDSSLVVAQLPPFDVGVYSNLYPNQRVIAQRLSWLFAATRARPGQIFVATIEGLLQKTLPYSTFVNNCLELKKNSDFQGTPTDRLNQLGYISVPTVEDVGTYSVRGGILDVFSPGHPRPFRFELFGNTVESIRSFDTQTQMTTTEESVAYILPAREVLYSHDNRQKIAAAITQSATPRPVQKEELQEVLRAVAKGHVFYGVDFLLPYFYEKLDSPLDYFSQAITFWVFNRLDILRSSDNLHADLKKDFQQAEKQTLRPAYSNIYLTYDALPIPPESKTVLVDNVLLDQPDHASTLEAAPTAAAYTLNTQGVLDFAKGAQAAVANTNAHAQFIKDRFGRWLAQGYTIFVSSHNQHTTARLKLLFDRAEILTQIMPSEDFNWMQAQDSLKLNSKSVVITERALPEGFRIADESLVFLRDEDVFGKRNLKLHQQRGTKLDNIKQKNRALEQSEALSFGELQPNDLVVHRLHGVGIYQGLKVMQIGGVDAEFIELRYKEGDRLYLPVYRVGQLHKYSGPANQHLIDKLGGTGWLKTQTKVRSQLRDVADKLLRLYAKRAQTTRPPFDRPTEDYSQFEASFPYQETDDQLRAIQDVLDDLTSDKPMDRLVCGDVGFGKTEVALRATFRAVQSGRQVAIIAPTTILTYQHYENFKKRFAPWAIVVRALNRFVSAKEVKQTLADLTSGTVDVVIGTHRLLSKDVQFKNLGLLIIDEEQKFGVVHKERLRHMRELVDTLALSATPIPRTLNMSLLGIRDLSIINTPPEDRLPTRTFVCKYNAETIRKAIESEISRGGQIFFLHNRVQSIDLVAANIRKIVPHARIAIAHGQLDEEALESTMLKFFNHELDILVCTAIIESGMDIPRANTIFINDAHTFGLSQLYQLRGRVGRSKERAYCYLILPADTRVESVAIERLKIIQENTPLGSGLRVSQYDLELRGSGDILGEDQSGHINAVGYELYTELLEEVLREQKGEDSKTDNLDPEINLRVPALLPDKYIPDIRMRLYYYKVLSNIRTHEDFDKIENELRDQFGKPPEPVLNLLGLMLIRKMCRDLGVKDVSAGKNSISLAFTDKTRLPPQEVIRLTSHENKKYQLAPDQRLKVRLNDLAWPRIIDELEFLLRLCH